MNLIFGVRDVGPKELAAMTGLSPAMQRDWRRAGHILKTADGWASYSLHAVAAVALRKTFADSGLGPSFGKAVLADQAGERAIESLVWFLAEADDWTMTPDVAEALESPAANRGSLVDQITGIAQSTIGRLLILAPATQEFVVHNEPPTVDAVGGPVVQVMVDLTELARRVVAGADSPLITVTSGAP